MYGTNLTVGNEMTFDCSRCHKFFLPSELNFVRKKKRYCKECFAIMTKDKIK